MQITKTHRYFYPKVEIKVYNVMINGQNSFDHPEKTDLITYDTIQTDKN